MMGLLRGRSFIASCVVPYHTIKYSSHLLFVSSGCVKNQQQKSSSNFDPLLLIHIVVSIVLYFLDSLSIKRYF